MDAIDITTLFGFGDSPGQIRLLPLVVIFLLLFVLVVICSRFFQLRMLKSKKVLAPVRFIYQDGVFDGFILSLGSTTCKLLTLFPLTANTEIEIDLTSMESFPPSAKQVKFAVRSSSVKLKKHSSAYRTSLLLDRTQNSAEVQNFIMRLLKNEYI